jgi:sporulation protein YlmC with PRC-barrel domain
MRYQESVENELFSSINSDGYCHQVLGATTLIGSDVYGQNNEDLGNIREIMFDIYSGKVCYAVMSYGGFLGVGEKLFAVPWQTLKLDTEHNRYVLDVDIAKLDAAPSFDRDNWPNMADEKWADGIHSFYGTLFKRSDSIHSCV